MNKERKKRKIEPTNPVWIDEEDEKPPKARTNWRSGTTRSGLRNEDCDDWKALKSQFLDRIKPEEHRKRLWQQYKLSTVLAREPKWAELKEQKELEKDDSVDSSGEDDDDDAELVTTKTVDGLIRFAGKLMAKSKTLPVKHLDFKLLKDPTIGHQLGAVADIKFHPSKPVLLTGTTAGRISLFQLCEDAQNPTLQRGNHFLQDVSFQKFRIDSLSFFDDANSILASATNRNYCYTYDLLEGRVSQIRQPIAFCSLRPRKVRLSADGFYIAYLANTGDIYIFVLKTMDHVHTFRASDHLIDFCFSPIHREILYAQSVNGTLSIWTLRQRTQQQKFFDEGCVRATCMTASQNCQFIACGSNTGIVNVYNFNKLCSSTGEIKQSPTPDRAFDQLTTAISSVKFSRDAQLVAMSSDVKSMSARLGHCSSGTAFENFPAKQEHFASQKIISCEFSPNNAFCAFGTNEGKTRLYRLNHFHAY